MYRTPWVEFSSPLVRIVPSLQSMEEVNLEPPGIPESEMDAMVIASLAAADSFPEHTFYAVSKALGRSCIDVCCYELRKLPDKRRIMAICRDDLGEEERETLQSFALDSGELGGIAIVDTFFLAVCPPRELVSAAMPRPLSVLEDLVATGALSTVWGAPGELTTNQRGGIMLKMKFKLASEDTWTRRTKAPKFRCYVCNATSFRTCGRCERVAYCSKECQNSDWRRHKKAACSK